MKNSMEFKKSTEKSVYIPLDLNYNICVRKQMSKSNSASWVRVVFRGTSTMVGYLMPNPLYTCYI